MTKATIIGNYGDWRLKEVLIEGPDQQLADNSLAIGEWDGIPVLACRYDMRPDQPTQCGYPNVRGYPRWFVLPDWMYEAVVDAAPISPAKKKRARDFLSGGRS